MISSWWLFIATCGPLGYSICPGTLASFMTMLIIYAFYLYKISFLYYSVVTVLLVITSFFIVNRALIILDRNDDPSEIVIDEVIGVLISFWGVKLTQGSMIVGFILFRFFDVSKWCGVSYFEKLKGSAGIVLDDFSAGVITNILLRFL